MDDSITFTVPASVSFSSDDSTIIGALNTTDTDQLWDQFDKFYLDNEKAIEKCLKTNVHSLARGERASDIELQIDAFSETTKVVLDGLAGLGKIHPVIGVAVVAFHAVISLDLSRRDSDRKVIAIMLEMQNMMCAMFQLRHLKHTQVQKSERDLEKSRLHRLIASITADLTQCGSDLNYYLGQKFAYKLIKAKNFEQRFKMHVENFAKRRSELQTTITVYIAGGIDQATDTITEVSKKLDVMNSKMDDFDALLRRLDTPKEKDVFRFFTQNDGVEKCISQDEPLARFLTMIGDVISDSDNKAGEMSTEERIKKSRKILMDEMNQNFEDSLKQNILRFERLLTLQNNNHERVIAHLDKLEGNQTATASKLDKLIYYLHPDIKLNDPEIKRVWERMGLKTSVKAKNFVLTFRDHYQHDHSAPPTPNPLTSVSPTPLVHGKSEAQSLFLSTNFDPRGPVSPSKDPNAWLLDYIDAAHVRPIVEAMDADGSGFISVKEINTFAHARPKEWSLLQWMVYWAAGWHINITQYRKKIYDILVQMHELLPSMHPANRVYVDRYLDSYSMGTIEGILRSTKSLTDGQPSQVAEMAQFYADAQESALRANLKVVSYVISSVAEATLVAGPARAESWVYPLLYLLLERHLAILKLARTQIINDREMAIHVTSLESVLDVFEQRMESLTAIFSQIYQNVAGRFETFAYGMFHASYKEDTEISPAKNTLLQMGTVRSWRELILAMRNKSEDTVAPPDTSILALEKGAPLEFEDLNVYETASDKTGPDHVPHLLEGYWSTTCLDAGDFASTLGLFHFVLSVAPDGSITGTGESYVGPLHLTGTSVSPGEGLPTSIEFKMVTDNSEDDYIFEGTHNSERDTVTGSWHSVEYSQGSDPLEADAADADAMGAQENVPNVLIQDAEPVYNPIAPSGGGGDPVDADQLLQANTGIGDAHTEQISVASEPTGEPSNDAAPNEHEILKALTQMNTTVEDGHTFPENMLNGEQQSASINTSTHDDIGFALGTEQPRGRTPDGEESEEDNDSDTSESTPNPQTSGDVSKDTEGAADRDVNQEGSSPTPSTFLMRRTPADMCRFRRDLNLETETDASVMARNRWKFATQAIRFQVQLKNMSWEYVRARFAERRLWLDLTVAFWQNLLPPDRLDLMCTLTMDYSPSQSRLYESVARYLDTREYPSKTADGITCDFCGYNIVCDRYRCITCMNEDLSNQIDLCTGIPQCIESASSNPRHNFVHTPSHTLLRQKFLLHEIHLSTFIPQCRTRSENIKKRFRTLEENRKVAKKIAKASKGRKSGRTPQTNDTSNVQPLFCVCCKQEVLLPCWICATCVAETAVCLKCELQRCRVIVYKDQDKNRDNMHSHDHLLLRIHDSEEVQSREVNNVRLQRELVNITKDLKSLKQQVNTALKRITADGDVKVVTEHPENDAPAVNGETAAPSAQQAVNDDDLSDVSRSTSSDSETEAMASAPSTPLPAEAQALPVENEANGKEGLTGPSETGAAESAPEVKEEEAASLVDEAPMDTPKPGDAQFFETPTAEPDASVPQNGPDSPAVNAKNGHLPEAEAEPEAASGEPPTQTSKSHRLNNHLVSIGTQISSLDTRMTSVDTRISSLDNRLSGVENQLGEILALLRQSRS